MVLELPGGLFGQNDVRETPASTSSSSSSTSILAPIGAIMPWLKSYTNTPQALPDGWHECDGSAVSDADSVFDGQNLPDLNGGEFIRGSATSGGTGGSATMAHTHSGPSHTHSNGSLATANHGHSCSSNTSPTGAGTSFCTSVASTGAVDITGSTSSGGTGNTGAASNTENRPPYYNVVWIMRIK